MKIDLALTLEDEPPELASIIEQRVKAGEARNTVEAELAAYCVFQALAHITSPEHARTVFGHLATPTKPAKRPRGRPGGLTEKTGYMLFESELAKMDGVSLQRFARNIAHDPEARAHYGIQLSAGGSKKTNKPSVKQTADSLDTRLRRGLKQRKKEQPGLKSPH